MTESVGGSVLDDVARGLELASDRLTIGVALVEAGSGQVVFANRYAQELWARLAEGDDPWSYRGWRQDGTVYAPEEWPLRRALRLGEVVETEEIAVEFSGGVRGVIALSAAPVARADGETAGAVISVVDLTEHRRAEDTLAFMAEASRLLSENVPDYEQMLNDLTHLVVPRLADWCAIDLKAPGGGIQNVGVAHIDPTKVELARRLQERFPPDPDATSGVPQVLRSGRSQLTAEITDDLLEAATDDPELRGVLKQLGLRSAIVAPMVLRGQTIGALTLISAEQGRRYTALDVAVAEDLGQRAALAINNARLYRREAETSRALQESLIPPAPPDLPGVRIGVSFQAAGTVDIGGDFYDAWSTGDGSFAVVIGDVQGKGPAAAAVTALARHTLRATSVYDPAPGNVLRMLNRALLDSGLGRFCTAVYIHAELASSGVRLAVGLAGHAAPMVLRDGVVSRVGSPGTLLGVYPTVRINIVECTLEPSDLLVMWTDGVTDPRGGESAVGEPQIAGLVRDAADRDPQRLTELIARAVPGFDDGQLLDDVAVLAIAAGADMVSQRGAA